jgi:Methyltransferase domain
MAEHMLIERGDMTWIGVDKWAPQDEQPAAYVATNDVHARRTKAQQDDLAAFAIARVRPFGKRAQVMRMESTEAARHIEPGIVDLVFLDADHSYAGVRADIAAWWTKVKPGGWLCGHDYANPYPGGDFSGVKRAVDEFAAAESLPLELDTGYDWCVRKPRR